MLSHCSLSRFVALFLGSTFLTAVPSLSQDLAEIGNGEEIALAPIVVTARKVEEDLQDAPISLTVTGADQLGTGRIDQIRDLEKTAPNVSSFFSTGSSFVIRGVGAQNLQGINNEMGVGVFVDDVYIGRNFGVPSFLDDLERVEVVRGAQATLYGKNTIGGAVNLIARRPGEVPGGNLELSYGTDQAMRLRAGFDQPLLDGKLRTRTFLSFTRQDGTVDNIATGDDLFETQALGGRFTAEADLSYATAMRFSADYERIDDDGKAPWAVVDLALDHKTDLDFEPDRSSNRGGSALRFDHDLGGATLTSITGYRAYDHDLILDGDFSSGPYDPAVGFVALQQGQEEEQWQVSQEFRLTSARSDDSPRAGDLRWKAGLFFSYEDFDGSQFYDVADVPSSQASRNALSAQSTTYAVYGDLGYFVTDNLELTVGGRYTHEIKKGEVKITSPTGNFFFGPNATASDRTSFSDFAPEFGVNYRPAQNLLTYAKVSKGYKSGGHSQFLEEDGSINVYDPETSWSYEIGVRSALFQDRLRLNASAFYIDWQDQQSNVFVSDFQRIVANASSASSRGVELEAEALLSDTLQLRASYGYLDAKYDDFRYTYFSAEEGRNVTLDFTGNRIPYAPKHTASLALDWTVSGDAFDWVISPSVSYRSSYSFDPVGAYEQSPTTVFDLNVSLIGDRWTASIWGRNLTDEKYLSDYFLFGGVDYGIAAQGRTLGVSFSTEF